MTRGNHPIWIWNETSLRDIERTLYANEALVQRIKNMKNKRRLMMRKKTDKIEYATIRIKKSTKDRIVKERDEFQKLIGGGTWSLDDALKEIFKIADSTKKDNKCRSKCKDGCLYSRSMDQEYPRRCMKCGHKEKVE